jgi:cytoskeletal protein RodZ
VNSTFSLTRTTPEGRHALGFGVILIVMGVMILGGLYVLQVIRLPQKKDPTVKVVTPSSQSTRRGAGSPIEQPLLLKDQLPETHRRPSKSLEDLYRKYGQEQGTNQAATANTEKKTKTATTGLGDWIPRVDPKRMPALHSPN